MYNGQSNIMYVAEYTNVFARGVLSNGTRPVLRTTASQASPGRFFQVAMQRQLLEPLSASVCDDIAVHSSCLFASELLNEAKTLFVRSRLAMSLRIKSATLKVKYHSYG